MNLSYIHDGGARAEDLSEMGRHNWLHSYWMDPAGQLFDAGASHADFATKLQGTTEELLAENWLRINISPLDQEILVQGKRGTRLQRTALRDLSVYQALPVVSDDGYILVGT